MLGLERRQKIMEKLRLEQKVYVSELAKLFKVTEETIRRDLEKLEAQDLLRRSYGGAMLTERTNEDLSYARRSNINSESKLAIAQKAVPLISSGDTVMVDASTTCYALLQQLRNRKQLTVITNSVRVMNDFAGSDFTLICTGGDLRPNSCALTGPLACRGLAGYYVDFALISCKGLDQQKGLMESNESEGEIKTQMMQQARKTILLADHSKWGKTAFVRFAGFEEIETLVTDIPPAPDWQQFLAEKEVRLID